MLNDAFTSAWSTPGRPGGADLDFDAKAACSFKCISTMAKISMLASTYTSFEEVTESAYKAIHPTIEIVGFLAPRFVTIRREGRVDGARFALAVHQRQLITPAGDRSVLANKESITLIRARPPDEWLVLCLFIGFIKYPGSDWAMPMSTWIKMLRKFFSSWGLRGDRYTWLS